MNRKAIATLVLAGLVIVATSGASGGCGSGGDGGTSAPAVGAGGEQSPLPEEHSSSSAEETPNGPSESPDEGHDPCNAHLSPITVGHKVSATLTVGPCADQPEEYSGSLTLQYGTGDLPNVKWTTATLIPIYSENATQPISAPCQDAYWVVVYDASGRDAHGKDFQSTHSVFLEENQFPRKANCP
jgi:hypothetical protein